MTELFNLNISDYSINELKELLNLSNNHTLEDIVNNENILREKLLIDNKVSENKKLEIIGFLDSAKNLLMDDAKKRIFPSTIETTENKNNLFGGDHDIIDRTADKSNISNPNIHDNLTNGSSSGYKIQQLLAIDSRFRKQYDTTLSTNFTQILPTTFKNVISMELTAFEIPSTYYQISKSLGNNYFWLKWADPRRIYKLNTGTTTIGTTRNVDQELWYYIPIPDGNYIREDMENTINAQIKKVLKPDIPNTINSKSVTGSVYYPCCKIDQNSVKATFYIKNGDVTVLANLKYWNTPQHDKDKLFEMYFNLIRGEEIDYDTATPPTTTFDSTTNGGGFGVDKEYEDLENKSKIERNYGWIMGYRKEKYTKAGTYVSEGCYDAWGTKYLYIIIDDFNKSVNNFVVPAYNDFIGKTNILARISTEVAGTLAFSQGLSLATNLLNDSSIKKRYYFGPVDINRLRIEIVDEFGRTLDLNNMDWSMALNLVCVYD